MRLSLQGTWAVVSYRDGDGMVDPGGEGREPELIIDGDAVAGTMGVNRLMGRLEDGVLGPALATTMMAGPPEAMRQEQLLLDHIRDTDTVKLTEDGMVFTADGLTLVEFRRTGTDQAPSSS